MKESFSDFHIKQGDKFEVKELFKDISRMIKEHFHQKTENLDILDIGCASGELPRFLKNDLKTSGKVYGFDISKELVENARKRFAKSSIEFFVDDVRNFKIKQKFDVITMTSVLSYFDDPYPIISNVLKHLRHRGLAIISGIFNEYNLEVRTRYKLADESHWRKTAVINQFPLNKIIDFINTQGYACKVTKQIMPFDISPKENPIRSWCCLGVIICFIRWFNLAVIYLAFSFLSRMTLLIFLSWAMPNAATKLGILKLYPKLI